MRGEVGDRNRCVETYHYTLVIRKRRLNPKSTRDRLWTFEKRFLFPEDHPKCFRPPSLYRALLPPLRLLWERCPAEQHTDKQADADRMQDPCPRLLRQQAREKGRHRPSATP